MTAVPKPHPMPAPPTAPAARTPPLQNGDTLTADEFERRFDAMPGLKKAELINGVVYLPPPVSDGDHGVPHFDLIAWLGMYRFATPGVVGGDNSTLRLDPRNRPQPDALLRILRECGGRVRRDAGGYLVAAPDLVAEVAASSASYALGVKLDLYRRYDVREYVVWRVYDVTIDWFALRNGVFVPLPPGPDGIHRSEVFPGLWLDTAALIRGDVAALVRTAQQGLGSAAHADFVARLQQAGGQARP